MATSQSWTAWLLGDTSNAVPSPSAETSRETDEQRVVRTGIPQSHTSKSSVLPYGPYVRTGRGGAGNFTWQSQESQQMTDEALEAQTPFTLSERRKAAAVAEHLDTGEAVRSQAVQRPSTQYIRVGRGIIPSNDIQLIPRPETFSGPSPIPLHVTSTMVAHPGRGGAGNQAAAVEANERALKQKLEQERIEAEKRREKIEQEVQDVLPPPADAWLGGRRRSVDMLK